MGADIVGKGEHVVLIAFRIVHGHFHIDAVTVRIAVHHVLMDGLPVLVQVQHKLPDAPFVVKEVDGTGTLICEVNSDALVQEGQLLKRYSRVSALNSSSSNISGSGLNTVLEPVSAASPSTDSSAVVFPRLNWMP